MRDRVGSDRCRSPIEISLCQAFMELANFVPRDPRDHAWEVGHWPGWFMSLLAEPSLPPYRCDFAIVSRFGDDHERMPFMVVIEADGHKYHERTKEQARHDRARDRWMTALDIRVLRFTGSEIYADADDCAREALLLAIKLQRPNLDAHFAQWLRDAAAREGLQ